MKKQPTQRHKIADHPVRKIRLGRLKGEPTYSMHALAGDLASIVSSQAFARVMHSIETNNFSEDQCRSIARMPVDRIGAVMLKPRVETGYDFPDDGLGCGLRQGQALILAHYIAFGSQP